MKRTNKKIIAISLLIILVASFITFNVFAQITGSYTIKFTGAWTIGNVTVTSDKVGPAIVLDANDEIELTNFNPDTMRAIIEASDGFTTDLTVVDGKTSISTADADQFPNGTTLEFKVIAKNGGNQTGNVEVQFDNATINGNTITFAVDTTTSVTATVSPIGTGKASWNGEKLHIVRSELNNVIFTLGNTFDSTIMEVAIVGDNQYSEKLEVNGDNEVNLGGLNLPPEGGIHFAIQLKHSDEEEVPQFDGNAYFVWLNSNNTISYHKFTNLKGRPEIEGQGYEINYINVSELTDESGNNSAYIWGQEFSNWVLAVDMEDEHGAVRTDLTKTYIFGDGIHEEGKDRRIEMGVQLDPTGAEDGENSICSNGDRNFRTTIYREGYNAIEFSSDENDYTYFPCFWDQMFFSATVDISGTTKDNPAEYDTYLLEPTISFTKGQFSDAITSVEALDINQDAVEITSNNGVWTIEFNSNYYDNVVFKITAGGKTYFVKINRLVLDIKDNFGPDTTDTYLIARLFYSRDKAYNDFDVIATVIYNDGKTETKVLSASELRYYDVDDANRTIDTYTLNGGKGLYESQCYIKVNQSKLVGAYFTIVKKGALEGDNYKGTFSGSGEGTYYDAETRDIVL